MAWTLQALREHVGVGADLLLVGLRSPVIRSRNMTLRAFEAWPVEAWPAGSRHLLSDVAGSDPNDEVRTAAAGLPAR